PPCALLQIPAALASVGFLWAFAAGNFLRRALQVFPFPDFINQTEPFASFNSSSEGYQHALGPHACFSPLPFRRDFSALFSQWHSRQFELLLCFLHASTFLPPLAPR